MIRVLECVANMDRSGAETMLLNYYRHFDKDKVQLDFLCSKKKPGAYDDEIKSMGSRLFYAPSMNPLKFFAYVRKMKALYKEHPEWKIVHSHTSALGWYPLFAAKCAGVPVRIVHMHNSRIPMDKKWPIRQFCKSQLRNVANHLWGCGIAANTFYYGEKSVKNGEAVVINNAIELDKFRYNSVVRNRIRKDFGLEGKIVIGHIGRFIALKNQSLLVDILAELKKENDQYCLALLGDGPMMDEIREKARSLGLEKDIVMPGNIGNANEWYQAFDIFMLPSTTEGLPVVGVEAQAADLPCIFSANITKEIGLLSSSKYLSLEEPVSVWTKTVSSLIASHHERVDRSEDIRKAGYDIEIEARKLQDMYIELEKQI